MIRKHIVAELSAAANRPAPEFPQGMTDKEELEWLKMVIENRRQEQGISLDGKCRTTSTPSGELSAALSCYHT